MTSANDPVVLEMIATCEHLCEGYSRALQAIEQLTTTQLEGRTMSEAALIAHQGFAVKAATELGLFSGRLAQLKSMFRVH
jgi:hypothetical protein